MNERSKLGDGSTVIKYIQRCEVPGKFGMEANGGDEQSNFIR